MRVAAAALIVLLCAHDAAGFSLAQSLHGSPAQHSVQRRDGTERLARAAVRQRQTSAGWAGLRATPGGGRRPTPVWPT